MNKDNEPSHKAKHNSGSLTLRFAIIYLCFLFVAAYVNRIPWLLVAVYLAVSLVTFCAYWWDKASARKGRWRIAESSLHIMSLLGGWPGALLGQRFLRHKSSKQKFLYIFWVTVFLNVAVLLYLAWVGDTGFIYRFMDGIWHIFV